MGVGWHGGHCFTCEACRRGDFQGCERVEITGLTFDGDYAEYATVPAEVVGAVPDELDAVDAALLLCAGITTLDALRHTDAGPGDLVAVQGVGGLGHLGVQYAHAAGFGTVALSRSPDKEALALELGGDHFVDTSETAVGEALQSMGGARVVLATAPTTDAISAVMGVLGRNGEVGVVGVPGQPAEVDAGTLVRTRGAVRAWSVGHAKDWEDTLAFSALREVTPEVETHPLEEAAAAYERMLQNEARFRVVLEP